MSDSLEEQKEDFASEHDSSKEVYGSYGEHFMGMIRHLFLFDPCAYQRHNIFKYKCEIEEKFVT